MQHRQFNLQQSARREHSPSTCDAHPRAMPLQMPAETMHHETVQRETTHTNFGQTIGQGFDHDDIVIIELSLKGMRLFNKTPDVGSQPCTCHTTHRSLDRT